MTVVGGGNMGTALVKGLVAVGWAAESLEVVELDDSRRSLVAESVPGVHVAAQPSRSDGAVIAVKPADADGACAALAPLRPDRVLSVMAGVGIPKLRSWLGDEPHVLRAMPNTAALVAMGASALAGDERSSEEDLRWAEEILGAVGTVVRVGESLLDAVTGLSGSGPAWFFYVVEALVSAGVAQGIDEQSALELVVQTMSGAAALLDETGERPEVLRHRVTSPGGTTAAGLEVLSERGVASALVDAVAAATERARELGR